MRSADSKMTTSGNYCDGGLKRFSLETITQIYKRIMKRILLFAAALALSTSCVDNDFDLSNVTTDDIGIGSDETVFKLPLANITVKWSAIIDGEDTSIEDNFNEADTWIPERLPDGDSYISIEKISNNDNVYVDKIIDGLLDDISKPGEKRSKVIEMIAGNSEYQDMILPRDPVTGESLVKDNEGNPINTVDEYINANFDQFKNQSKDALRDIVDEYLKTMDDSIEDITNDIEGFGLDDEIIDMLGDGGTMRIYGDITNYLPVDCTGSLMLTSAENGNPVLDIPLDLKYKGTSTINIDIQKHNLAGMADDMVLTVHLEPKNYYPRSLPNGVQRDELDAREDGENGALKLNLKLEKTGGLSLGSIIGGGDEDDE